MEKIMEHVKSAVLVIVDNNIELVKSAMLFSW